MNENWEHKDLLYTLGLENFFEEADKILRAQNEFLKSNLALLSDWLLLNTPLK